ncbi:MAG: CarD family transcriptional regulator [Deltaproteobacteria bacterium]|nr:CarD family transcriptional regulator [Deltaproteobacteria bacterium]
MTKGFLPALPARVFVVSEPKESDFMSFSVGDKAVHPAHGVGEITQIEERLIGSDKIDFYILKLVNGKSGTIRVALNAVDRVGLRQVMSRSAAKTVLEELKKDEMAVTSQPWNRRYREYTEMLKSGSPIKVAKVLRDLAKVRADKGELSYGEKKLMEQARKLLITELALARRVREETVERDIDKILN